MIGEMVNKEKKDKIKQKVFKDNKEIYLSAQDYAKLDREDKEALRKVLAENNIDADEYDKKTRKLWPKEVIHTVKSWRHR